jgi:preprotein translocase subunit YajC
MIWLNNIFYFMPVIMVYFLFYFIVIRPGRIMEIKRYDAVDALKGGERIILTNGLIGFLVKRDGVIFHVKLDEGFEICVLQNGIKDIIITNTKNTEEPLEIEHEKNDIIEKEI